VKKIVVAITIVAVLSVAFSMVIGRRGAMAASDAEYVANKKCRACHKDEYKTQVGSYHAMSFENLTGAGEEANPECLPCHTTGYGKPGGFVDAASTPDLAGTTCQACHGPGSAHVKSKKAEKKATIEKTPKDACTKCHRTHEAHPDIGAKSLPSLKKKLERVQARIDELGG
jgi:hypothetical protein